MALPIIVFFFFVIVAVVLFVIGFTRYSVGAGFSFTALSSIFFILTGLLLWTTGLQTDTLEIWDTSTELVEADYQVLTFADNLEIQMLAYFFTFGGFFPLIIAIRNVFAFKQINEIHEDFEWAV